MVLKVKIGGVIVCDDYNWLDQSRTRSVKNAVYAFIDANLDQKEQLVFGEFLIRKLH